MGLNTKYQSADKALKWNLNFKASSSPLADEAKPPYRYHSTNGSAHFDFTYKKGKYFAGGELDYLLGDDFPKTHVFVGVGAKE